MLYRMTNAASLAVILGGGVAYMYYAKRNGMAHVDITDDGKVVYVPAEKYDGTTSFQEWEVDDNGNPLIDKLTGKIIMKTTTDSKTGKSVPVMTSVRKGVEDIFNYSESAQSMWENKLTSKHILQADMPEWERKYMLGHLSMGIESDKMEAVVQSELDDIDVDSSKTLPEWCHKGDSFYQSYDSYGDWKAENDTNPLGKVRQFTFKYMWNSVKVLTNNKRDINMDERRSWQKNNKNSGLAGWPTEESVKYKV